MEKEYGPQQRMDSRAFASLKRPSQNLPVIASYFILASSWLIFIVFVSLHQVLLRRHEVGRFLTQMIIYNTLMALTVMSYMAASSRRPMRPDQSLAPPIRSDADASPSCLSQCSPTTTAIKDVANAPKSIHVDASDTSSDSEDDIPLRFLKIKNSQWVATRGTKDRPSPLPLDRFSTPRSQPEVTTVPLSYSAPAEDDDGPSNTESAGLLANVTQSEQHHSPGTSLDDSIPAAQESAGGLMAKGTTGGPRWCRKCQGWKPDRCHHCSSCGQCVLRMDHHCPWLGNCVGYHNYKPFILFITYGALLGAYTFTQSAYESYRFFRDPSSATVASSGSSPAEDMRVELEPVLYMLLTIYSGCLTLTVGGLAGYHWYLMMSNRTTMEDMRHSFPTALLDTETTALLESLAPPRRQVHNRGSRFPPATPTPTSASIIQGWKGEHELTRSERMRLRRDARDINVYDVGGVLNIRHAMVGDGVPKGSWVSDIVKAAWPLHRAHSKHHAGGHFFPHDPRALARLKRLTAELRLGIKWDDRNGNRDLEWRLPRRIVEVSTYEVTEVEDDDSEDWEDEQENVNGARENETAGDCSGDDTCCESNDECGECDESDECDLGQAVENDRDEINRHHRGPWYEV